MSAWQDCSGKGEKRDAVHRPSGTWGRTSARQGGGREPTVVSGAVD